MKIKEEDILEYGKSIKLKSNAIDETRHTYGALTVIAPIRLKDQKKICWHCKCSCGNEVAFSGSDLRSGKRTSCGRGCNNFIDEVGKTYGFLKVLFKDPTPPKNFPDRSYHWICECQLCGSRKSVSGRCLRNGDTKSCGCLKSYGERLVAQALEELGFPYFREYTFDDCRNEQGNLYRFDFAILNPDKTIRFIIEFNGCQHFKDTMKKWNKSLTNQQEADEYKHNYCVDNHIHTINFNSYGNHHFEGSYEEILDTIKEFYKQTEEDTWYVRSLDYNFGNL